MAVSSMTPVLSSMPEVMPNMSELGGPASKATVVHPEQRKKGLVLEHTHSGILEKATATNGTLSTSVHNPRGAAIWGKVRGPTCGRIDCPLTIAGAFGHLRCVHVACEHLASRTPIVGRHQAVRSPASETAANASYRLFEQAKTRYSLVGR